MLIVLIDEDLPRSTQSLLTQAGIDSIDVRDSGLRGKSDEEIFDYACENKAIILTADRGFGSITRFKLGSHYGIVVLRNTDKMTAEEYSKFVLKNCNKVLRKEIQGCVAIVEENRIRIKR